MMAINIGDLGEQLVTEWLQSKSYRILERNWYCRWGEIDIIAEDKTTSTLIFIEVKTRKQFNWDNDGSEAISLSKQQKISKSAALFLGKNVQYTDFYMRFDVALVRYEKKVSPLKNSNSKNIFLSSSSNYLFAKNTESYQIKIINYLENAFEVASS